MGEEEVIEEDPVENPFQEYESEDSKCTKDRSKNAKFLKMFNSLPAYIKEAWENTKKLKTVRTEAQRVIVNEAIDRNPVTGKLVLNTEKQMFQEMKDIAHVVFQQEFWSAISLLV